jgi:hypothetical protein
MLLLTYHSSCFAGNASDNLEAVSEAASNHSVASSLELENDQNDNLSDMVSANVSGRGTPNISGKLIIKFLEFIRILEKTVSSVRVEGKVALVRECCAMKGYSRVTRHPIFENFV